MSFPPQAYCELHGVPMLLTSFVLKWTTVLTLDLAPPELPFLRVFPRGTGIGASQVVPVQTVTSRPSVQTSPRGKEGTHPLSHLGRDLSPVKESEQVSAPRELNGIGLQ